MSTPAINYAHYIGYDNLPASIVFAVLYAPLFFWFLRKSFTHPTYVHFVLTLFCLIRVVAFIIRAVLAGSSNAGTNLGLVIADQILFGVGYFGLLYSAYTLVLDLEQATDKVQNTDENPIITLTKNRRLFRLLMTVAVALGITASSNVNSDGSSPSYANALREASTIIFLVMTALLVFQTVYFARIKMMNRHTSIQNPQAPINTDRQDSFGAKHGIFILVVISLLLLIREIFITATMTPSNRPKQYNEHFWYPFVATTEFLAVVCYVTPGLVPSAKDINMRTTNMHQDHDLKESA
ncbi:hypothetical protein CPB83DRAFT_816514 [Crepidotus variabilis]|uniref:DUF7702 domain-containing protein n=1 Tax=Crepidotus variabilis TaxID=179855 RepID=A0A9P6JN96_9AGAR|nr:hypothetical protein CPB83DRAFT_816514 [Crepidotus variabilis]